MGEIAKISLSRIDHSAIAERIDALVVELVHEPSRVRVGVVSLLMRAANVAVGLAGKNFEARLKCRKGTAGERCKVVGREVSEASEKCEDGEVIFGESRDEGPSAAIALRLSVPARIARLLWCDCVHGQRE